MLSFLPILLGCSALISDLLCSRLQDCAHKRTCTSFCTKSWLDYYIIKVLIYKDLWNISYYASIMLNAFRDLLCSELCWHNDLGLITFQHFEGNLSLTSLKNSALLSALSYNNVLYTTCDIIMVIPCT